MNHETRIAKLEKEIAELKDLIKELTRDKWMTLKEASRRYQISSTVLRNSIKSGKLTHLKDWKRNGNRYLVNVKSIQKIS